MGDNSLKQIYTAVTILLSTIYILILFYAGSPDHNFHPMNLIENFAFPFSWWGEFFETDYFMYCYNRKIKTLKWESGEITYLNLHIDGYIPKLKLIMHIISEEQIKTHEPTAN